MAQRLVGMGWLKEHFGLHRYRLSHTSFIGTKSSLELTSKGNIEEVFGTKYAPEDSVFGHLEFGFKYDDISLDFLKAVFDQLPAVDVESYIHKAPSGRYARKLGFLYEFLTGRQLALMHAIEQKYIDLLEDDRYVIGQVRKNAKWRINDNLLGDPYFCPIVRKTQQLLRGTQVNITDRIQSLKGNYPPDIFSRAISYLYNKETRSSYQIEKEEPSPDRMERFVTLLMQAGVVPLTVTLQKERLVALQNAIVDPRFAASNYRDFQNYVGATLPNYTERMDYMCPPPEWVSSLMEGIQTVAARSSGINPQVRAAILSFGFVFIHPFEDGNGRLHRFLIHDVLTQEGVVPKGMIIPVSAHMLNNMRDYDLALEAFSKPLMQRVRYEKNSNEELQLINAAEVEGYYRYPDLTEQSIYLADTLLATVEQDMPQELTFLQRYHEAKIEIQRIVDMPDRDINAMLLFLHQNGGVFPKRRRDRFIKLTNDEIERMQVAYQAVYQINS